VLTLLESPSGVDELAQKHRLEPEKLARDLTRLADLRLVVVHGPVPLPRETPSPAPAAVVLEPASPPRTALALDPPPPGIGSMAKVVIGHGARRSSMIPLLAGGAALILAVAIWYGTRPAGTAAPATRPPIAATVPALTSAAAAAAPPASVTHPTEIALPAPSLLLRANGNNSGSIAEIRPARQEIRTTVVPALTVGSLNAAPTTKAAEPRPAAAEPRAASIGKPSPVALANTGTVAAAGAPPASGTTSPGSTAPPPIAPSVAPATAAELPPPIQLAAVQPMAIAPKPAVAAALKPISREPPEFPKEAIADGLKSGLVTARLHVDARGNVTAVDILGAQPPQVFDRAVRRALMHWQFEPNAAVQTADVDVKFQRD
jgi:TonB family protein